MPLTIVCGLLQVLPPSDEAVNPTLSWVDFFDGLK